MLTASTKSTNSLYNNILNKWLIYRIVYKLIILKPIRKTLYYKLLVYIIIDSLVPG
jgi:hypothetical protein